jgi:hypothetical protein
VQDRTRAWLLVALLPLQATDAGAQDMEAPFCLSPKRSLSAVNHKAKLVLPTGNRAGRPNPSDYFSR